MSEVIGVNATIIASLTPATILDAGDCAGKVRVFQDTYEASALASGSTITMGPTLPAGAKIVNVIVSSDNLGNNTTLAVGDSDDTDRYITATDHGAAVATTALKAVDGLGYEIGTNDGDDQILITTAAGAGTGTITLVVFYTYE